MKKSLIWLLTIVMSITFCTLLYFQIMYLENMVKMREEQFSEGVMRSLYATSEFLEKEETLHYLEQDMKIPESGLYVAFPDINNKNEDANNYSVNVPKHNINAQINFPAATQDIGTELRNRQELIRSRYLYQKGVLNELILLILRESGTRPIMERADSTTIKNCLRTELANNGLQVPFVYAVKNPKGGLVYATEGFGDVDSRATYTIPLFVNTDSQYTLSVEFPTKGNYIFSSVRFIIPTLALTVILLVIFLYTIVLAFRQKKLTEMKTDFINNMTHELKTPISTISLAGQMLSDPSIRKSPSSLAHLSEVITEESKRLRFQVEKVLQMSVFDNTGSALKFTEVNANTIISNVVNTFKLKVEKYGGTITTMLEAQSAYVSVDEMQFTNVIFNLLDNAVKYTGNDKEPQLEITTRDIQNDHIEIRIKDNGIGIRKDDLKRIFEKFYRVSTGNVHNVKGFGLGLAYVKKMITLFGGSINVESEYGVGSTFIIVLPLVESRN